MKTVIALYDDFSDAHDTLNDLTNAGFSRDKISLINNGKREEWTTYLDKEGDGMDAGEGAAVGAVEGTLIGGIAGLLAGLGTLALPGLGTAVAAGPLVAMITGAGVGAAAGSLTGALVAWGLPDEVAGMYSEAVRRGSTLVAVEVEDHKVAEVSGIMDENDPVNIERKVTYWRENGWDSYDEDAPAYTTEETEREFEAYRSFETDDYYKFAPNFRRHYHTHVGGVGQSFSYYEPGYRYGYMLATNDNYNGYRDWGSLEPEARSKWSDEHDESTWEEFKDSVRHAWEEVKDYFDDDDDDSKPKRESRYVNAY